MNKTTIRLRLSLFDRWRVHVSRYRETAIVVAMAVVLLFARELLNARAAPIAEVVPTPALRPIIMVQTATAQPPLPTSTAIVVEVYIAAPTPPPIVEYVEVPVYIASEDSPAAPQQPPAPVVSDAAPPEAPSGAAGVGGSGTMAAPEFQPLSGDWCAAAASAGVARCTEEQP